MNASVKAPRGKKSSKRTAIKAPNILKLMDEVGGAIDQAMELAAREAALEHIRDGRNVPVWENEKVVWKPAAVALAETDAAARRVKRR